MCRSEADANSRPSVRGGALLGLLLVVFLCPGSSLLAQGGTQSSSEMELTSPVSQALGRLPELWIEWVNAFYQDDSVDASATVGELNDTVAVLGMRRLPDLALAASIKAVESAEAGDPGRSSWALDHADRLDDGLPETAFARAQVSWSEGRYLVAMSQHLGGWFRIVNLAQLGRLWAWNGALWALYSVVVAGALFLLVQMAVKGHGVHQDLLDLLGSRIPPVAAHILAVLVLVSPIYLPSGYVWLLALWSFLLWRHLARSEKIVALLIWLVLAGVPWVLELQDRQLSVVFSPPERAMNALREGRLYGSLFVDLSYLTAAAPDSLAAQQLLADVHRQLGQWEEANAIYRDLLEEEPGNFAALVDVGCYYFRRGDSGNAIRYFQMGTAANNSDPAGFYNLSQAYSDSYLFDEHKQALARARAADERKLAAWIQNPPPERVIALDGGFDRIGEIRDTLRQASGTLVLSRTAFMPLAIPGALLASGLVWRLRRRREVEQEKSLEVLPRVLAVLLPGVPSARQGRGGRAFLGLLVPTALLLLPFAGKLGHVLPWGLDPGSYLAWTITTTGLFVCLAIRWYLSREKSLLVMGGGR